MTEPSPDKTQSIPAPHSSHTSRPNPKGHAEASEPLRTLTVTGNAQVSEAPTALEIVASVTVTRASAAGALADNTRLARDCFARLDELGIPAGQVSTTGASVSAQRQWVDGNQDQITGYQGTQTFTVRLPVNGQGHASGAVREQGEVQEQRDVQDNSAVQEPGAAPSHTNPERLLTQLFEVGGDELRLDSMKFTNDDDAAYRAAQALAFQDAKEQAMSLARMAGVTLGEVLTLSDTNVAARPPRPTLALAAASEGGFAPGKVASQASVTVTFRLG